MSRAPAARDPFYPILSAGVVAVLCVAAFASAGPKYAPEPLAMSVMVPVPDGVAAARLAGTTSTAALHASVATGLADQGVRRAAP